MENLDLQDVECLKYSLSKGLGIGIVVGGSIMKVPQLLLSEFIVSLDMRSFSPPYARMTQLATVEHSRALEDVFTDSAQLDAY